MRSTRNSKTRPARLILLAMIGIGLVANPLTGLQAQTNSVKSSTPSATPVSDEGLRRAAAEAVEELKAARLLLEKQGVQIAKQEELLRLEKEISSRLKDLRTLDAREKEELRRALVAKDRVIAAVEKENAVLRRKRFTLWKAIKVAIVAGAAGIIAGKVF